MNNIAEFKEQFLKQVDKLAEEIEEAADDAALWKTAPGITNSVGTLALHLAGNLQHFLGAQLGKTGYVRDRDKEFSTRGMTKMELIEQIAKAKAATLIAFEKLTEEELQHIFPLETFGKGKTTHEVLILLFGHLNYHLGQINYLRRVTA